MTHEYQRLKIQIFKTNYSKQFFILVFCIFALPVFDVLTGAFFKLGIMSEGTLGSPSQVGRLIALFLLIFFIFNSKIKNSTKRNIFYFIAYFLFIEVGVAILHKQLVPFLSGVVFFSKFLFCILVYVFLKDWVNKSILNYDLFFRLIISYGVVLSVLLMTAFLSGFHISNYGSKFATRGLFASGNGIGITIGIASLLSLYYYYRSRRSLYYFLGFFMIICTAVIGTKTAFLFILLSGFFLIFLSVRNFPILTLILLTLVVTYILPILIEALALVFENIIFKYNKIDDKSVLLASSRDVFIQHAFDKLNLEGFSSFSVLFGGGAYFAYESFLFPIELKRKFLENDLFELFFCYGLTPALAYLFYLGSSIVRGTFSKKYFLSFCLFLVSLHSLLAGHVLFNGTSSIMLVFILLLIKSPFHIQKY